VTLAPYGSRGDLQPFLALARMMRERGDDVIVAIDAAHRGAVEATGVRAHVLPCPQHAALGAHTESLARASARDFLRILTEAHILPGLVATMQSLRDVCRDTGLIVASPLQLAAPIVAELLRVPWATVTSTPLSVPTPEVETTAGSAAGLTAGADDTAGHLDAPLRERADRAVSELREALGLDVTVDVLGLGGLSQHRTAVTVSPCFTPRPADWPDHVRLSGFVFGDLPPGGTAGTDGLRRLLEQPDVIAVCAGSMAPAMLEPLMPFYRAVVDAIRELGARPLLLGTGLPDGPVAGGLAVTYAPLSSIYDRCSAVIHHGGTGTTALALRAGVPALVVPWASWAVDRAFNAARIEATGAGLTIAPQRLDASTAAAALRALLDEPSYREAARALKECLRREDGLGALHRWVTG
jgi:sterol 3beta-glucosyltransferase